MYFLTGTTATGVDGFTAAVGTAISAETLWGGITPLVPFIGVTTIFALGVGIFMKFRNKARSHK